MSCFQRQMGWGTRLGKCYVTRKTIPRGEEDSVGKAFCQHQLYFSNDNLNNLKNAYHDIANTFQACKQLYYNIFLENPTGQDRSTLFWPIQTLTIHFEFGNEASPIPQAQQKNGEEIFCKEHQKVYRSNFIIFIADPTWH